VQDGLAYTTAGMFPAEGVHLVAMDARTGAEKWRRVQNDLPAQGYLLASRTRLYIPAGRNNPAVCDVADGRRLRVVEGAGGTYALLTGDMLVFGPGKTGQLGAVEEGGGDQLATFQGNHMVVTATRSYLHSDTEVTALDRARYLELARERRRLTTEQAALAKKLKQSGKKGAADASPEESRELSEFARAAKEMALAESPLGIGLSSEQNALFQLLRDGDGGSDGVLLELQRQLTQAQLRRQQLAVQFGPKHDAFRQVEAEIVRLEQMLRNQMSSLMDSLEQRLVAEDAAVDEMRQRYDNETREMKSLDNFVAQDAVLRAEIKRTEDAYGLVFAQLKQVSLVDEALTKGRSDVSVIDLEPSNEKPPKVWPLTGPLLMLSFAVGIFGALLWIYSGAVLQAGAGGSSAGPSTGPSNGPSAPVAV